MRGRSVGSYRKTWKSVFVASGPTIIKLFESENELKCKNHLHGFIETLCLFSKILEYHLRSFTISLYRYNCLVKLLLFSRKSYGKILENILKFYDGGPRCGAPHSPIAKPIVIHCLHNVAVQYTVINMSMSHDIPLLIKGCGASTRIKALICC